MTTKQADRSRLALGRYGEALAAAHLRSRGMRILSQNWTCRHGELDIVAADGPTLVICEVKTRTDHRFGSPFEAVTVAKLARLRRLAGCWLEQNDIKVDGVRIDVVGVIRPRRGPSRVLHRRGV